MIRHEFVVPKLNLDSNEYFELINWQDTEITEPPLTVDVPEADIRYQVSASGTSAVSGGSAISVSCQLISSKFIFINFQITVNLTLRSRCVRSSLRAVIINGSIVRYDTVIDILINFKLRFDIIIAAGTDDRR